MSPLSISMGAGSGGSETVAGLRRIVSLRLMIGGIRNGKTKNEELTSEGERCVF